MFFALGDYRRRMDTSSKTGNCGCWRRCKSASPSRRMLKIYTSTFLNLFSSAFAITMLFPYLPFMVEFLLPELEGDQQAIGKSLTKLPKAKNLTLLSACFLPNTVSCKCPWRAKKLTLLYLQASKATTS